MHDNLIFLDIDGVLTSMDDTPGSYITHSPADYGISPTCFSRLLQLCQETDAKVVISSNWRNFEFGQTWSYNHMPYSNPIDDVISRLGDLYVGSLPRARHVPKSSALREWVKDNEIDIRSINYVVFDDDDAREKFSLSEFADNFIPTDVRTGLTDDNCTKAKAILTRKV